MTKEEILELHKWLILQTRDNGEKLQSDPMFFADWSAKYKFNNTEMMKLNSCDADWVGERYVEWYNKEIKPYLKNPQNPQNLS